MIVSYKRKVQSGAFENIEIHAEVDVRTKKADGTNISIEEAFNTAIKRLEKMVDSECEIHANELISNTGA